MHNPKEKYTEAIKTHNEIQGVANLGRLLWAIQS